MARSPIGDTLRRARALAAASRATGIPPDELDDIWSEQQREARELLRAVGTHMDRRTFLRRAVNVGVLTAGAPALVALASACTRTPARRGTEPPKRPGEKGGPRIAIVGAGLSGLTAAYRLHQAGYATTVYEASDRAGGRAHTLRDFFVNGETVELCGEYINSDHRGIRDLADELGLSETNLWASYPGGASGLYWFGGRPYLRTDVHEDFAEVYPALHRDRVAAGWPTTWDRHTPAGVRLDRMTLAEWIEDNVPGGRRSRFGRLIEVGYAGEYGLDAEDQSALNLMFEAGFSKPGDYRLYGYQDWKWRIDGGNDLVATTMVEELPSGTVHFGRSLTAIRRGASPVTLVFDKDGGGTEEITADLAILTLPFTTLRHADLNASGFSKLKRKAIDSLGMGTNSKLHLQFAEPVWLEHHISGDITTDLPIQSTTVVYPIHGSTGILDNYTGGSAGASYETAVAYGAPPADIPRAALAEIEKIVPGAEKAWNGKAYLSFLVANPYSLGSYSCPRPGEYTSIFGAAKIPEGNVLFAGEHTSINFFGFMNGAVETGERAAKEALALLGAASPPP